MIPTTRDIEPLSIARFAPRELGPLNSKRSVVRIRGRWFGCVTFQMRIVQDEYTTDLRS